MLAVVCVLMVVDGDKRYVFFDLGVHFESILGRFACRLGHFLVHRVHFDVLGSTSRILGGSLAAPEGHLGML